MDKLTQNVEEEEKVMTCRECGRPIYSEYSTYNRSDDVCLECLAKDGNLTPSDFLYLEIGGALFATEETAPIVEAVVSIVEGFIATSVDKLSAEGEGLGFRWRFEVWEASSE